MNVVLFGASFYVSLQREFSVIFYCILNSLDILIANAVFIQYSFVVENIRCLFKSINKYLNEITKESSRFFKLDQFDARAKLDEITYLYSLLSELSEDVTTFYSFLLLWSTFNNFVSLFTNLYLVLKRTIILKTAIDEVIWDLYNIYYEAVALPVLAISVSNTVFEVMLVYL